MSLLVFVTVKLRSTDEATLRAFNVAVKPVKQILECHMTGGGFDYLIKLRVKDMVEYRQIHGGVIGEMPMVEGTHSYFVMEEVKETTLLPIPQETAHDDCRSYHRAYAPMWRSGTEGLKVAVVPTMGALHDGHLTLVRQGFRHADRVVVTIFVNPKQFAAHEDLGKYPRTEEF